MLSARKAVLARGAGPVYQLPALTKPPGTAKPFRCKRGYGLCSKSVCQIATERGGMAGRGLDCIICNNCFHDVVSRHITWPTALALR